MFERFARTARAGVVLAQEEARDAGSATITPTHLLIGILGTLDSAERDALASTGLTAEGIRASATDIVLGEADATALQSIGINLNEVAGAIERRFGFDIRRPIRKRFRTGHIPFASGTKQALRLSLSEAIARKERTIEPEHVLLGLLQAADPDAVAAIGAVAEPGAVRARLHELLDRPAA
ncbi:Clp protease N-terminal domain-containing protein [Lolliginicoccus levis]|uniref:Clp protease N-terminal domain-containing protein n=1 Tax=Lolliginicoccus levis TaxID=2919542 RepID=UPI00241D43F6|nr:Clp protease N-terminal domain-containing protein [Lolliginicoccus levis]